MEEAGACLTNVVIQADLSSLGPNKGHVTTV